MTRWFQMAGGKPLAWPAVTRKTLWALGVAVVFLSASAPAVADELIVNGGFEVPVLPDGTPFFTTSDLPGWMVFGPAGGPGNVDVILEYWPPAEGRQSIDLVGNTGVGTGITQPFATEPGVEYLLSFQYANNVDTTFAVGNVRLEGATVLLDQNLRHEGSTRADMNYTTFVFVFVADSKTTTLTFTHLDSSLPALSGLALDAVSVIGPDLGR